MSVLSRLGVAFKSGFMGDVFDIPFLSSVGPNTTAGERISRETAMTVSAYYACVDLIAGHIAGFPHRVVQDTADGASVDMAGVSRPADVAALARLPIAGLIIGRALYEGTIDLPAALSAVGDL